MDTFIHIQNIAIQKYMHCKIYMICAKATCYIIWANNSIRDKAFEQKAKYNYGNLRWDTYKFSIVHFGLA